MKTWKASAPSNIALIKYMGKVDSQTNLPSNASISLTLEKLRTYVEIEKSDSLSTDVWECLKGENLLKLELSEKGQQRFLRNWQRLKNYFQIEGNFILRSASNFPSDCGIASSASSFAALTLAAFEVAKDLGQSHKDLTLSQLADLSRQSSGSSCRSLFSPWGEWGENVKEFHSVFDPLYHYVVIVDEKTKQVSSSEAHLRVASSLLFQGRKERAEKRLESLKSKLRDPSQESWRHLHELCWQEFWDMQTLFETSQPSFGYMTAKSLEVLNWGKEIWQKHNDGPLMTMDAGPNVHFLWRNDQKKLADEFSEKLKHNTYQVVVGNE